MNDSVIRDGNFENIGSKVFDTLLAAADSLAMHVPVLLPHLGRNTIIQIVLFHIITELCFKDLRHGLDWQIEVSV